MKEPLHVKLKNLGTINKNKVTIERGNKSVDIYFSYETPVAVDEVVSENIWSRTTGKFLNELQPNKKQRVPYEIVKMELQRRLKEVVD